MLNVVLPDTVICLKSRTPFSFQVKVALHYYNNKAASLFTCFFYNAFSKIPSAFSKIPYSKRIFIPLLQDSSFKSIPLDTLESRQASLTPSLMRPTLAYSAS